MALGSSVLFYIFAVPMTYAYFFLIFKVLSTSLQGLALTLAVLLAFLLVSIAVQKYISGKSWTFGALGLKKEGFVTSILATSVISVFSPLAQLWIIQTQGMATLTSSFLGYPGSVGQILRSLPTSLLFFLGIGVLAFGFFQAFPFQLLKDHRLRWALAPVVLFWAVLYGSANFVLGEVPSLGDIGLFGVLFLVVFVRTGSSVGPILSYVLFAEEPAWVGLALLSPDVFVLSLYVKIAWSVVALSLLVWVWANKRAARNMESISKHTASSLSLSLPKPWSKRTDCSRTQRSTRLRRDI